MKLKKTVIFSIVAALLVGAAALAALSRSDAGRETRAKARKILRGALSPEQLRTLRDFRTSHRAERDAHLEGRPNPSELWFELALTDDQQDKLAEVADAHVDELAASFGEVRARFVDLRNEALDGGPDSSKLEPISLALGRDLGVAAVAVSRAVTEARAMLTSRQIEILEGHRAEHRARLEAELDRLPQRAEELAGLWTDLALTPAQVEALSELHRLGPPLMHERRRAGREEFREDLAKVLDDRQLGLMDAFHEQERPRHEQMRQERRDRHESIANKLNLTSEQKIALANLLAGRHEDLANTARLVAGSALDLADLMLAPKPDEAAIARAAENLGRIVGYSSILAAQIAEDARTIIEPCQAGVIRAALAERDRKAAEHLAAAPARVHRFIDFLDELALSPDQKNQIMVLIGQKHAERKERFGKMRDEL